MSWRGRLHAALEEEAQVVEVGRDDVAVALDDRTAWAPLRPGGCPTAGAATHRTGSTNRRSSVRMPDLARIAGVPRPPAARTTRSAGKELPAPSAPRPPPRSPRPGWLCRATRSTTRSTLASVNRRAPRATACSRMRAAVPLGAGRTPEHAPAAPGAAFVVDELRSDCRVETERLTRREELPGHRAPAPLVRGGDGKLRR